MSAVFPARTELYVTDQQKENILTRRQRLVWCDWMLRHAPEVLLFAAGLPLASSWFASQRVFTGSVSIQYWSQRETQMREFNKYLAHIVLRRYGRLDPEKVRLPIKGTTCLGGFAARAYESGSRLLPQGLVEISAEIAQHAAIAWWASNDWRAPANRFDVRAELNDPLKAANISDPALQTKN